MLLQLNKRVPFIRIETVRSDCEFLHNNKKVGSFNPVVSLYKNKFAIDINIYDNNLKLVMPTQIGAQTKTGNEKWLERYAAEIYDDELKIGAITPRFENIGGSSYRGYYYNSIVFRDQVFKAYKIGFGSIGQYSVLYHDNEIVGMISKRIVDSYLTRKWTIYFEDLNYLDIMAVYAVFLSNAIQISESGEMEIPPVSPGFLQNGIVFTMTKKLVAKFDNSYIPRLREAEGLPGKEPNSLLLSIFRPAFLLVYALSIFIFIVASRRLGAVMILGSVFLTLGPLMMKNKAKGNTDKKPLPDSTDPVDYRPSYQEEMNNYIYIKKNAGTKFDIAGRYIESVIMILVLIAAIVIIGLL